MADASPAGPRWFARALLELLPAAGAKAWTACERLHVARLVVQHIWRDATFLEAIERALAADALAADAAMTLR